MSGAGADTAGYYLPGPGMPVEAYVRAQREQVLSAQAQLGRWAREAAEFVLLLA